jgi:hypothetical protein
VNAVDVRGVNEPVRGCSRHEIMGKLVDYDAIKDVLILDG